ncbi:OmpA family protein [Natronoflexus pectinivorans]|uniref:Outer membrane protein OmpA-like peptidoglycan-associated protein n=1 Tax=Natronoflexus pectinivorans TaxID=682526 RepID=A0A4R2GKG5_9BACT|nr:OmpA family protein [Natronoflexus pectinivorans]TCO09343.1 outer membrane protein OmpA-like peptidoglycan-associated protein [Natronoflexus pectinivorans]
MRPYLKSIFIFLFLLSSTLAWSQGALLRRANNEYNRGEYYEALQLFQRIVASGYELDIESRIKVAHCHYDRNNIMEAWSIFSELEQHLTGHYLFLYASSTHKIGFYEGAIDLYRRARPENPRIQGQIDELIRACEWALANPIFDQDINVLPSLIPTFGQSFGIQYFGDGVVYSSASPEDEGQRGRRDRTGRSMLDLYYSELTNGSVSSERRLFSQNLVFPEHVGATSFTPDQKRMYYTRVVRVRGGSVFKIFSVEHDGRDWVNERELPFNSNDFDTGYPAVTPCGKFLYFASNRPGGYGGMDIYMVEIRGRGNYGPPRNLGPEVNTFGNEVFPFISQDDVLYFSSDGHIGFGGLDVFKAANVNGNWRNVENMMQPMNSSFDDFAFVINPDNPSHGFFSTNRRGDGDNDELYAVRLREPEDRVESEPADVIPVIGLPDSEPEPVIEEPIVEEPVVEEPTVDLSMFPSTFGTMVNSSFDEDALENASVRILDSFTGSVVARGSTGSNGRFLITIPDNYRREGQEFEIEVSKSEYHTRKLVANILELTEIERNGITLTRIFREAALNEISGLIIPYVGSEITQEGYRILDQVAGYLQNNPHVVIRLNAHTDARGDRMNNLTTSQNVSEVAKSYLESNGISGNNIIARGYGERYLLNNCSRGKLCSDSEHLENRRVEVVIWRFLQ